METIETEVAEGRLLGERPAADLCVFRGVPYAAPPIGPRRFSPPAPAASWTGTRPATAFAPSSVQPPPDPASAVPGDPMEQSEDCLYLNVWTPACDSGHRPVMVWLHGGGYVGGSASSALYDGAPLVQEGVVVVTVGYRLGALGWLAHPALGSNGEGPFANWGLMDQLAALSWVRKNAASFGGDPENVTVFGESAGAISIASLLAGDDPKRYFDRAVLQSGAPLALGADEALAVAEALARELGLDRPDRSVLGELPPEVLLRAQTAIRQKSGLSLPFQPVVDGNLLPDAPAHRITEGSASEIDLLIGTNRDEWRFWLLTDRRLRELDWDGAVARVAREARLAGIEDRLVPAELVESYRELRSERGEPADPADVYCAIATDWTFRVPSMRLAAAQAAAGGRSAAYLFDWESPLFDGLLRSCHAVELPFVFGTFAHPFISLLSGTGEEAGFLSGAMRAAWTSFAYSGGPSAPIAGDWPSYEASSRLTKRLGREIEVVAAPLEGERQLLEQVLAAYGSAAKVAAQPVHETLGDVAQRQRQGA